MELCGLCGKNKAMQLDGLCRGCARVVVLVLTRTSAPVDRRYR
jgi:hypothetical protein